MFYIDREGRLLAVPVQTENTFHAEQRRQVALKILPEASSADPDRLARFEREARVLASLNHLNIGHIYGLEEAEGQRVLVLELVEAWIAVCSILRASLAARGESRSRDRHNRSVVLH